MQTLSPVERLAVEDFTVNHKRDHDGRFVVRLPFKSYVTPLGESRPQALKRFLSLERRLHSLNLYDDYSGVINEYLSSGHAEAIPVNELNKPPSDTFYLPHHAVHKESTTTPVRVCAVINIPTKDIYAFTDSTIVLYWIYGTSQRLKTFEANRVSEIQVIVPPERWKHVKGNENPADAGSRGVLPKDIVNHELWWSGLHWLI